MSKTGFSKSDAINAMAGHVLENGMGAASLRPLAKAAGTSDRMLIYHFGSRDGLIVELLQFLSDLLKASLTTSLPEQKAGNLDELVHQLVVLVRSEQSRQFTKVWLEILAEAGRGNENYRRIGGEMMESYLTWLTDLLPDDTENPKETASFLLTLIEGMVMMDAVGREDIAKTALERLQTFRL